jgi:hypothetical protein
MPLMITLPNKDMPLNRLKISQNKFRNKFGGLN